MLSISLSLILNGCATKTIKVIDTGSDWVRLSAPVKAKVSTYQGAGVWVESGTMELPAGWYAGPGQKK
jgi:hypothetical protein